MPDWRTLLDSETLGAWDLKGRDWTLTISKVQSQKIKGVGKRAARKAVLTFMGAKKQLVAGATILDCIAKIYGRNYEGWIGKKVTLYPTTCESFGESGVPCVRVRPTVPSGPAETSGPDEPVDEAMRAKQMAAVARADRQPGEEG